MPEETLGGKPFYGAGRKLSQLGGLLEGQKRRKPTITAESSLNFGKPQWLASGFIDVAFHHLVYRTAAASEKVDSVFQ